MIRVVTLDELDPADLAFLTRNLYRAFGLGTEFAGNKPMQTEIAPLLIITKLEEFDYPAATAIAVVMLAISFGLLLLIQLLQRRSGLKLAIA